MNFCNKCEKQTPTKVVDEFEECMVCGEIINKPKEPKVKTSINSRLMNDLNRLKHTDKDTGKYTNAQNVGRNVLIGIIVIVIGILYSVGGFGLVINTTVFVIIALVLLSITLYAIAMAD